MIEFFMIGNLGADAVKNMIGDRPVLNFAVCHSEAWRNRPENIESKKYWVDCAYLSDSEELLKVLLKGTQVYVKGTPDVRVHVKKDGEPIAVQYLRVSKIEVLSKKRKDWLPIKTKKEFDEAKKRFEEIYDVDKTSSSFNEMNLLATLIGEYERNNFSIK